MANAAVAADLHQTLDIGGTLTAQVAFDLDVRVDVRAEAGDFLIGQVADLLMRLDTELLADRLRGAAADAVDVRQPDLDALLPRDIDSGDTCH